MGYSQEEINRAIIYRHRLCDRLWEVTRDIRVLDKATLLSFSEEDLIEIGQLMLPVQEKMLKLRKKRPTLAKELDSKVEVKKRI
jgi:hypothetical protein